MLRQFRNSALLKETMIYELNFEEQFEQHSWRKCVKTVRVTIAPIACQLHRRAACRVGNRCNFLPQNIENDKSGHDRCIDELS